MLGAPPSQNPDLDESRNFCALLARKTGGAVREKKEKKVKNKKYILMQHAIPVADGQVQAIRRLGPGPSPRGSRVFLGYARTKRFCLTQNRIKEEDKWRTWSQYPPLPPIFYENTAVHAHWTMNMGHHCHKWISLTLFESVWLSSTLFGSLRLFASL